MFLIGLNVAHAVLDKWRIKQTRLGNGVLILNYIKYLNRTVHKHVDNFYMIYQVTYEDSRFQPFTVSVHSF